MKILEKLFCLHDYEEKQCIDVYAGSERPSARLLLYMCKKCGKDKRIELASYL